MLRSSFIFILSVWIVSFTGQVNELKNVLKNYSDFAHFLFYKSNSQDNTIQSDTIEKLSVSGKILNIFNESVDNVLIVVSLPDFKDSLYCDYNGIFGTYLPYDENRPGQEINLMFVNKNYRLYDTTIIYPDLCKPLLLKVKLIPKYRILVKGRIMVGHTAIEDVDVIISHNDDIFKLKTKGCYYDDEDYWNCLYQGMFKQEIVTENPADTVFLYFSKSGFKPQEHKFIFADYSGELVKYRLKYGDSVPDLPINNFNLKLAYPLITESGWFLGMSYYRLLKTGNLRRFAAGLDISVLTFRENIEQNTFSGLETSFDTTYVNGMGGPSLLFYITKPNLRRFNTYIGSTFALKFNDAEFVYQPFAGVRFFLDMNKSISIDIRYLKYHFDAKRYRFNYLGNADNYILNKSNERLIINVGLQICF